MLASPPTPETAPVAPAPKRLVLCLDGTWNNPFRSKERDDGSHVYKPTNPLKLCRSVAPLDESGQRHQVVYYGIGIGAQGLYPGVSNRLLRLVDSRLGGAWGAGFERNVEDALTFLVNNYRAGDQVFIFGYSRGAAQAGALARFLDWLGGIPAKRDAYWLPHLYRQYIVSSGTAEARHTLTRIENKLQSALVSVTIDLLGVWDTVMALGSRFRAAAERGTSVHQRSFHAGEMPPRCVIHARQALAIDENRYDFRPEIWRDRHDHQTLEQRWFPGSHGNVGGSLVRDGLANISLRWMLDEAKSLGLVIDEQYTKFYRPHPQAKLVTSRTLGYRVLEAARLRFGRGDRSLDGNPERAGITVDKSAIHRLAGDPAEHDELELYRPRNLLAHLARQPDLDRYLASLGLAPEHRRLPEDVVAAIDVLRHHDPRAQSSALS
jgi:uncharacterized protein (DUF2235 family)